VVSRGKSRSKDKISISGKCKVRIIRALKKEQKKGIKDLELGRNSFYICTPPREVLKKIWVNKVEGKLI
jgi:hypothetical protein